MLTAFLLLSALLLICLGLAHSTSVLNIRPASLYNAADANLPARLALSESAVTRDVTIGGLIRLPSGKIQRTYGGSVKPASLCPT